MHAKHADNHELNELSGRLIGCAFTVLNTLGTSWKRSTRNALAYAVRAAGLSAVQQSGAKSTRRRASNAMHRLSENDRSATMPAA